MCYIVYQRFLTCKKYCLSNTCQQYHSGLGSSAVILIYHLMQIYIQHPLHARLFSFCSIFRSRHSLRIQNCIFQVQNQWFHHCYLNVNQIYPEVGLLQKVIYLMEPYSSFNSVECAPTWRVCFRI